MNAPSNNSIKSAIPQSDLPPNYDATEAEPHGFADGKDEKESPFQDPPEPAVPEDSSQKDLFLSPDLGQDPLYLDLTTDQPRVLYTAPDELLTQCAQNGHIEKTKFGTLSIVAATAFFPWGLLFLAGSHFVYCKRCGLVLRDWRVCKKVFGKIPLGKIPFGKNPFRKNPSDKQEQNQSL